ncbi:hypothetical protein [Methylomagnum ishizawai]|uniref:hypothetical protein n=1 Tax=Methylomagnum ishizawai TaxID=1760988 RepID=UPI001C33A1F1|nr:hypothetical protein [Methylomagnum ishizawai]BBL75933.1 hypothetical protein MishRS11D_30310 [Methylomagnum ishizawai]
MKIDELVEAIKVANPGAVSGITDKKLVKVVREALFEIAKKIDDAEEGVVTIGGFGRFHIKQFQREVDGQTTVGKRVSFKPRKLGAPGEADAIQTES